MNDLFFIGIRQLSPKPDRPDLLMEAGHGDFEAYRTGHIPGAVYLDTNELEAPPLWNRLPDQPLLHALASHGLTADSECTVYGRSVLPAARLAVVLLYAGVARIRLLDGGFNAWAAAGRPLESGVRKEWPVEDFGVESARRPGVFTDLAGVRRIRSRPDTLIVSVRSMAEYMGETSGYDWIPARGRIAGAIWGYSGSGPNDISHYLNTDGTVLPLETVAERWRKQGITPDKQIVFYCGTGWRASIAYLFARAAGWVNISVYDGGWAEWSADPANPVE